MGLPQESTRAEQAAQGEAQGARLEALKLGLGKSPTGTTSCCSAQEEEVEEQAQLELGFQGYGQGRGGPRWGWSEPGGWTAPTSLVGCVTGALQRCPPNSISVVLQRELS